MAPTRHVPVLLAEVLASLGVRPGATALDGTVGGGGHAAGILAASAPDGRLLGLDRDPAALARAAEALAPFGPRARLVHGSFARLGALADAAGFGLFDAILLDLGFSSDQVDDPARGLSFRAVGPLDMRLDPGAPVTAADLVNGLPADELADVLYRYGEERRSRRVARAIVAARPLATTGQLAEVVARAVGGRPGGIHPATRTFQALRIAVNHEIEALKAALSQATHVLDEGGRLVTISYHSLEDREIKRFVNTSQDVVPISKKVIRPAREEVVRNPRSRSAKLRVAERVGAAGRPPARRPANDAPSSQTRQGDRHGNG